MRKFMPLLVFALLISVPFATLHAQIDTPWAVYLYDGSAQTLTAITLDGSQRVYDLGLPPDTYPLQSTFPVSADQQFTAYCTSQYEGTSGIPVTSLIIRGLDAAIDIARLDLGSAISCNIGGFDEAGEQLAVGVQHTFPYDQDLDPADPIWSVMLVDVTTGAARTIADGHSAASGMSEDERRFSTLPIIQHFENGELIFSLQSFGTEGNPDAPAFRWTEATGALERTDIWGGFAVERLAATGETVWLDYDPARISGTPMGPMPTYNVVRVTNADGLTQSVFESGEWLPYDVRFIDGGRRLLITMLESWNPDTPEAMPRTRLVALNRSGIAEEMGIYNAYIQSLGAPDGYLLMWSELNQGITPPSIYLEYHRAGITTELWRMVSDNMGVSWSLAGSSRLPTTQEILPPFPAIG